MIVPSLVLVVFAAVGNRTASGGIFMIHKFKLAGYNIVVDVNSGCIHMVDDLTYDILDNVRPPFEPSCPDRVLEKLQKFYRKEDIWTCYSEVTELFSDGILFSEENSCDQCQECSTEPSPLRAVCLNISHDCSLRCGYCFAENGSFGGERCLMSEETAHRAVDFLIENSGDSDALEIYFFGGEPLMNFDVLRSTVSYARAAAEKAGKSIEFSLTTNGTLLDDEKTEYINREISSVVLSADGRKEINDSVRCRADGSGIYDEIMPRFRKLTEGRNGSGYCIRGTFTRKNTDFSEDVFSIFEEGFDRISIEPVSGKVPAEYALTELELPGIFREYDRLTERMIQSEKEGRYIDFFHFNLHMSGETCQHGRTKGCGCGNDYIAVTPSGDVYPCHQFAGDSEMCLGNIHDGFLRNDLRERFAAADVMSRQGCSDCWAKIYCGGGCSAVNRQFSGSIEKTHKLSCLLIKKRIECAIVLMASREERGENIFL